MKQGTNKNEFLFLDKVRNCGTSLLRQGNRSRGTREKEERRLVKEYLSSRGFKEKKRKTPLTPWEDRSVDERKRRALSIVGQGRSLSLFLYENKSGDTATFRYFGYNIAQRMCHSASWGVEYFFPNELANIDELLDIASSVIVIRGRIRPELISFLNKAKERKIPSAYIIDDNVLGEAAAPYVVKVMANDPEDLFEQQFWLGSCLRFEALANFTDSFIASTDFLANTLTEKYKRPAYVIHSSLNDEQVSVADAILATKTASRKNDLSFTMGYFSGTSSHNRDFALIKKPLIDFLKSRDDAVFLLVGLLDLDDDMTELVEEGKVKPLPFVDYVTLQYLQASVDVALAPLVLNDFTNCKSELKVFEAGVVGTPSCASASSAYKEAILEGKTGYLCEGPDEWAAAFERMYSNRHLTHEMGVQARTYALSRYYGEGAVAEVEEVLFNLTGLVPTKKNIEYEVLFNKQFSGVVNWDDPFVVNGLFSDEYMKDIHLSYL